MAKQFPKVLYVRVRDGGTGPDFLDASESRTGMVDTGEKVQIATYQLVGLEEASGVVATRKLPMPKRR